MRGAWRKGVEAAVVSPENLDELTPILIRKGAGGLAWRKIRDSALRETVDASALQNAWRFHTLQNSIREREVVEVFRYLRKAGIEPALAKGWAVERFYPQRGLRPYGDIDIWVQPHQYSAAREALTMGEAPVTAVELHREFRELKDFPATDLFAGSRLADLGDFPVRVLSPEHHFRLLCLHALHHGLWRPLWLADVALLLESLPDGFEWEICLGGEAWRAEGVRCTALLAHEILGASLDAVPMSCRRDGLPSWMVPAVLREWGSKEHYMSGPGIRDSLGSLRGLLKSVRLRWPNPILATFATGAPFNERPRFPYQLQECLLRILRFARL